MDLSQKKNTEMPTKIAQWSWGILLGASILQLVLFWSIDNAVAILCVVLAWTIVTQTFFRSILLRRYPFSLFIIVGFTCTQLYFPLLFTLLEGKPIVFNLDLPIDVFIHSLAALIVLTIAHYVYRRIHDRRGSNNKLQLLAIKGGFFTPPTDLQMWLMGFIGLVAMYYVYFYSPSAGRTVAGVIDKFIQGLIPFTYAPFFIPFGKLYGRPKTEIRKVIPLLIAFAILLLLVSMGRNSRGAFMIGFASLGFAFGLGILGGFLQTKLLTFRNVAILTGGLWLLTGPITDLSTAMVVVRGLRGNIDRAELVSLTLKTFSDKSAISAYKAAREKRSTNWDEHYMDNIFLARFSNIKYNDVSLSDATKVGYQDPAMFQFSVDRFWSTLPTPLLRLLAIDANKSVVNAASFGDYLYYRAGASSSALGGFRTSNFAGTGMAAFGWWYLLLLGVLMIPAFFLEDLFFLRFSAASTEKFRFSMKGLMGLTSTFMFLPQESIVMIGAFLLRGWIQGIVLYWIIFHLTRKIDFFLSR